MQGHPTDLFLTISVLQRKFCWLGTEVSAVLLGSKVLNLRSRIYQMLFLVDNREIRLCVIYFDRIYSNQRRNFQATLRRLFEYRFFFLLAPVPGKPIKLSSD